MKIVVDVSHPSHLHCFKNYIWEMSNRGHDILITASEKDVALNLIDHYGFRYINLGNYGSTLFKKIINIPVMDYKMYKAIKNFHPDIFIGSGSIRAAHIASMIGSHSITLEDTEYSPEQTLLFAPFTDVILTPSSYKKNLGKKQIRFNGYKQLAYLHPRYFTPDPGFLYELGLSEKDNYIIVRLIAWKATHDLGKHGIQDKLRLIKNLEKHALVFVNAEGPLDSTLEQYRLAIAPEKFHDLLYYAALYVGEGGSTASEAAILGTHAIHTSNNAKYAGVFYDLRDHDLLWFYENDQETFAKAEELLSLPDLKARGKEKGINFVNEKIDVTRYLIWFTEHFPSSIEESKTTDKLRDWY